MTLQFGGAQVPGPLGISPGGPRRLPGPIGLPLWEKQSAPAVPGTLAKAVKTTKMPPPTNDPDIKDVHVVTWPLFNSSKRVPAYNEVKQAPGIANCPVASMLAAMAFTPVGQTIIQGMVSETAGNVLTDLSGLPPGTLSNPPSGTSITSSRYFTVKLGKG